jgi:hypothetical protein
VYRLSPFAVPLLHAESMEAKNKQKMTNTKKLLKNQGSKHA